jgi:hypothetical protein
MAIKKTPTIPPKTPPVNPNDSLQVPPANPTADTTSNMFWETGKSRAPSYGNQWYVGAAPTNKNWQLPGAKPVSELLGSKTQYNPWSQWSTTPTPAPTPTIPTPAPVQAPQSTIQTPAPNTVPMPAINADGTINDKTTPKSSPFAALQPKPAIKPINDFSQTGITQNMNRMWSLISSYESGKADQIFSWFMDQLGDINMAKEQAKNGDGAKNLEDVYNAYRNVQMQFRNNVKDPNQIAQNTGLDVNTVNTILKGETNKLLTLTPEKEMEINKQWYDALTDAEKSKTRSMEDFQKTLDRSKITFTDKMGDLKQQMKLTDYNTRFYGAATGQNQSSGFDASLDMITKQQQNIMDRLTQQHNRDDEDLNTTKTRMLEDYTTGTERIVYSMGQNRDKFRTQVLSRFQDIMGQYGVASEDASKALQGLMLETQKMEYDNYNRGLSALGNLNEQQNQRLQLMQQYDFQKYKYNVENGFTDANGNPIGNSSSASDVYSIATQQRAQNWFSQYDNPEVQKYCKPDGSNAGQCAKYVNDMWSKSGESRPFSSSDQSIDEKINVANSDKYGSSIPVIGGAIVTDYGIEAKNGINYGHVETIIGFDKDGNYIVNGSNLKWDKKSYTRILSKNDTHIKWFTRAPGAQKAGSSQQSQGRVAPSNISPNAQSVWEGNTTLGDYTPSDRAKINSELQQSGFWKQPTAGNSKFQELKSDEHSKLSKLIQLKDDLAQISELKKNVDTGPIAWNLGSAAAWTNIGADENFITLDQITGKNLSEKMKEISGSAVSEQELARLKRWIPNSTMNDKQFETAVKNFNDELTNTIQSKMKFYNFSDESNFATALWYSTPQWTSQWQQSNQWWQTTQWQQNPWSSTQWGKIDLNDL